MNEFDVYAKTVLENPAEAVVFEGIEEEGQKFVLSLRGAFKRAGVHAVVRKMRGRDEVRAWIADEQPSATEEPAVQSGRRGRLRAKRAS
jgi:hypothetical protein